MLIEANVRIAVRAIRRWKFAVNDDVHLKHLNVLMNNALSEIGNILLTEVAQPDATELINIAETILPKHPTEAASLIEIALRSERRERKES